MSHPRPHIPDQERLRARLDQANLRGRIIQRRTAQELATWFAEAVGPGFATFRATGVVTPQLYVELGRLYDLREPEVGHWLHNLTRFVMAQPLGSTERRRRAVEPESER